MNSKISQGIKFPPKIIHKATHKLLRTPLSKQKERAFLNEIKDYAGATDKTISSIEYCSLDNILFLSSIFLSNKQQGCLVLTSPLINILHKYDCWASYRLEGTAIQILHPNDVLPPLKQGVS
jgi:hypothetical protein